MSDLREPFDLRRLQVGLRDRVTGQAVYDLLNQSGTIPYFVLNMGTEPTAGDTVVIGADTYEFRAAAADVSNDAYIAVELTGVVATTISNLADAINGADADNAHPTIFRTDSTTPALANGTETFVATAGATSLVVIYAKSVGGDEQPGSPSVVLNETLTAGADGWGVGNVNVNTLGGKAEIARQSTVATVEVTAAMIADGAHYFRLPWTVGEFMVQVRTATGALRHTANDTFVASATSITMTLAGGVAPDIQATDVVTLVVHEA